MNFVRWAAYYGALWMMIGFAFCGCRLFDSDCANSDAFCDPLALVLYNAPCHARSWSTFYGPVTDAVAAEAVVQAADSGFVMAGRSRETFGAPFLPLMNPGTRNIFVSKFDEDGALLWNTFLGLSTDRPLSMIETGDGYLIAGTATGSFGVPLLAYNLGNDGIVAKLDLNGSLVWHTYIGTALADELADIVSDGAGGFLVTGSSRGDIANAGTIVVANTDPGTDQIFVMKIDAAGTPVFQSHFGGAGQDKGQSIKAIPGGFVIGGSNDAAFNVAFTNQRNPHSGGSSDYVFVAFNSSGAYLWHTFHGAAGDADDFTFLNTLSDGRILAGGNSNNTWGAPAAPHPAPAT